MIFNDILQEKGKAISVEFDTLLKRAWENQSHIGNLLLLHVNGFFEEDILEWNKNRDEKLNPHVIGPGSEGQSEYAHYDFIHKYRTTHIHPMSHTDYIKQFVMEKWDKEISDRNNALIETEETTIQLEMLIYLKFWEADMIIKKFYQFNRILQGQNYDWYFKIANSAREENATGNRQDIIRLQIRDPMKEICPTLYALIMETYKTQIRNSIAHSNYSFLGRSIHLNNYIQRDPASQLKTVTFDDWINIFHNTLVLHNEYISMNNMINENYGQIAKQNGMIIPVLITEKQGKQYELPLVYREEFHDWHYKH